MYPHESGVERVQSPESAPQKEMQHGPKTESMLHFVIESRYA